jgi:hypothetical protein
MPKLPVLGKRVLLSFTGALVLLYAGDYAWVHIRAIHPKLTDPFESLTAFRILAIPQKYGKTEYAVDAVNPQQTVTCVHSIFPHYGYAPCWYVSRKIIKPIPMILMMPPAVMP